MVAEATGTGDSAGRGSVWERLRQAADLTTYHPQLRDGLTWRQFTGRRGEAYIILQNPKAATYLRLGSEDFFIFQLMDGSRSVQELVVEYVIRFRRFALHDVLQLVQDLRNNSFLTDPPCHTFQQVARLSRARSGGGFSNSLFRTYLNREFPVAGFDRALERLYRLGAWTLFTRPALILMAVISLVGVPLLGWNIFRAHIPLSVETVLRIGVPLFILSMLVIALAHELAHALTVKSYGRTVRRGGLFIFFGFPALFVDTQDMWMERRRARMAASWAGPYSGFILAGLCGLAIAIAPQAGWVPVVRIFGIVALAQNAIQLTPFVPLDGYYIVMDWLEMPNLRQRALSFLRHDLWHKVRRRERFTSDERTFALFSILAALYTAYALFLVVTFYWAHADAAVESALRVPNLQSLLIVLFLMLLLTPVVVGLAGRLFASLQALMRAARRATGSARDRWYRDRAVLLSQVPVLASLGAEPIRSLAPHLREEHAGPGAAVVRQGEPGDRFYLIVDGHARVIGEDGEGSRALAELNPMDYFGERALIENVPRTATVRAETDVRLLSLSGKDFRASIGQRVAADAALRARFGELAELDRFPLLQSLGPREKEVLLSHLRPETYEAGQTIIRQGEAGGDFYLLRAGRVEVTRNGETGRELELRTLEPGDFFGEIALLLRSPRIANVRALEGCRVWALGRQDFGDLLGQYFNLGERLAPVLHERLSDDRLLTVTGAEASHLPAVGDPAPDFSLPSSGGTMVSLSDYRGRPVLISFSTASRTDSSPAPELQDRQVLPAGRQATVLHIVRSADGQQAAETSDPDRTMLVDEGGSVFRAFGMYVLLSRQAPSEGPAASGDSWRSAMAGLLDEQFMRPNLAAPCEGTVLVGQNGSIEQIQRGRAS